MALVEILTLLALQGAPASGQAPPQSFESCVERRADADLRAWCAEHPWSVFASVKRLGAKFLDASDANDAAARARVRDELAFVSSAIEASSPAQRFADTLLGWGDAELAHCGALRTDTQALVTRLERDASEDVSSDWRQVRDTASPVELAFLVKPLVQVAKSAWQAGRAEEALELERALFAVAEGWRDGPWIAWHAEWLAQFAWTRGALAEAAEMFARATLVLREMGELDGVATLDCDLTSVELSRGELQRALDAASEAAAIARDLGSRDLARRAAHARASCHYELGELEAALAVLSENERDGRVDDVVQMRLDLLHAGVLADVGRLEAARAWGERATALAERDQVRSEAPLLLGEALLQLGLLRGDLGEPEAGLALLARAHAFYAERDDGRGIAWTEKNRGWVLLSIGKAAEARAEFERARIYAAAHAEPFLEGWCALGLAESAAASDGGAEAIDEALACAERRSELLHDLHLRARVEALRGARLAAAGERELALEAFARAIDALERLRARFSTPGLLTQFLRDKLDPYRRAAELAAELGRGSEALRFAELARARSLFELRRRREEDPGASVDPRVSAARRALAAAEARLRATDDALVREQIAEEVREQERSLEGALVEAELGASTASSLAIGPRSVLDLGSVRDGFERAGLDAVVEYVLGGNASWAIVARPRERDLALDVVRLPLGDAALETLVERLRAPLELLERGEVDLLHLDFDARAARELYDALLAPLGAGLGMRVAIVPDGCLGALPFDALVSEDERAGEASDRAFAGLRGLRFAIEQHAFVWLPSMAALASAPRARASGGAALMMAPRSDGLSAVARELETLAGPARQRFGELRMIENAGVDAASEALRSSRLVHIAAHGTADAEFPATSYLELAGEGEGARLEAWRIESFSVGCELVVLSSCHGGEGRRVAGEGVQSLARSFLAAGAREVVASLWAVEDRASAELMRRFYSELADGSSVVDALRAAKLGLIAADDARGFAYAHPYFWAAWFATTGG